MVLTASLLAAEPVQPPAPAAIPRLPVTTGGIANSMIRGYDPDDRESRFNRTYVQNYTSGLAVSPDGIIYANTSWEEGHRPAGTYRDGDCLPDHADFGTGSGWTVAVGERFAIYGHWGKVLIFERKFGEALDGDGGKKKREIIVTADARPPQITGLALDEVKGHIWVATGDDGRVRCFALDGTPIEITPINVPRVGGLALDHAGALWVIQTARPAEERQVAGTVFAAAAAQDRGAEFATETSEQAWYQAAHANGFCGMEFSEPMRLAGLRFVGGGETTFIGGKVEVSAAGKDGPWTQVTAIAFEPGGWPDTYLTLPSDTPLNAVRVTAPKLGLRNLAVFAQVPAEEGAVLRFAANGQPLPQRITTVANPVGISCDRGHQRLLVSTGKPDHQVLGFIGLEATPALDPSFGNAGRFGIAGGVYAGSGAVIGSIGPQRFDELRGAGTDAVGNLYVAMVGGMGLSQTRFESYDPQGALRWRLSGLSFIDAADLDPADETSLWSASSRYRLDHSKPAGNEWTHVAATVDPRYSADARANAFTQQIFGMRRINGQLYPMYVGNATTLVRWSPDAKGYLAAPGKLKHIGANQLTWQPSGGATGYCIERQDLGSAGWSAWQPAGESPTTTWQDAKAPAAAGHAWRVRALGATPSDWTFTVFHRESTPQHSPTKALSQ